MLLDRHSVQFLSNTISHALLYVKVQAVQLENTHAAVAIC